MRLSLVAAVVLVGTLVRAQDQTTTPKLSWKERAKLDYQRRYDKYILHKVDDENAIAGDSEINAIPLGTRSGALPAPPPQPVQPVVPRPPPPPPPTTTRRPPPPPPPSTTPYRPPPPPPTTTTARPPPPMTTVRAPPLPPPPPTTTQRAATQRTTEAPPPSEIGLRGSFVTDDPPAAPAAPAAPATPAIIPAVPAHPSILYANGGSASSGVGSTGEQQGTLSGTFQSRPAAFPASPNGGSFASSSATAFNSGGMVGGSSASNAGTFNSGGVATGTFTFTAGGASSASASTTGAVNKSPVALLGKVVQGIVRPITSILPAPLGPKGSNPGLVGGLVSGIFEELDGGIRAIYPAVQQAAQRAQRNTRGSSG